MLKKTLILGIIISSLIMLTAIQAIAAENEIIDDLDDVVNVDNEQFSDKQNIDIKQITYNRNGKTVTLTLTVKGDIENRGDIDIFRLDSDPDYIEEIEEKYGNDEEALLAFLFSLDFNYTVYQFKIETKDNIYNINYVNKEILVYDEYSVGLLDGNYDVDGSDLTVSFELLDDGDKLSNITVSTSETKGVDLISEEIGEEYYDSASGECNDEGSNNDNDKKNDNNGNGTSNAAILLLLVIVILIIVIAAVTYFIRR